MKNNIGRADKIIRIIIGIAIIIAGMKFNSWLGLIGVVPIITALVGWCPLYLPFGLTTCRNNKKSGI